MNSSERNNQNRDKIIAIILTAIQIFKESTNVDKKKQVYSHYKTALNEMMDYMKSNQFSS